MFQISVIMLDWTCGKTDSCFFAAEADLEETLTVRKSLLLRYSVNDPMGSWSVGEISERTKAVNHLLLKP